jgi:HD-GYP domain-containing protein (c-di-GMP phosphodiesterase class II)
MNSIPINQLQPGKSLSDDSYIMNDLFFMPKNLPVQDYHITLLRDWEIDSIQSDGILTDLAMRKIVKENSDKQDPLDKLFEQQEPELQDTSPTEDLAKKAVHDKLNNVGSSEVITDVMSKNFPELYKKWLVTTINFFNDIIIQKQIDKEKVKNFINVIIKKIENNKNDALMQFGKKFEGIAYIFRQSLETTVLANIIGNSLNLSQLQLSNLCIATLFHDLGMLKIPKSILTKKETLTQEEIGIIQNHTNIGYKYLREVKYSAIIASGALQHHERIDGKGYPNKLSSDRITEIAKIITVVDAYCAAITKKPFKDALHAKAAIQDLLRGGGSKYELIILRELIKNISLYPIGSMVSLSSGQIALVVGTSGVAMRPIIQLVDNGQPGQRVDLSQRNDLYIKGIYAMDEDR